MRIAVTKCKLLRRREEWIGIFHGPDLVLKDEASFRTINGIHFRWFGGKRVWIEVRA